jgi:hypothetical protein
MELERMTTREIMALPPVTMYSDKDEILARTAVMLARVREISCKPGSQKAMGEALAKVSESMDKAGPSPIQRMALGLVCKLFSPQGAGETA